MEALQCVLWLCADCEYFTRYPGWCDLLEEVREPVEQGCVNYEE